MKSSLEKLLKAMWFTPGFNGRMGLNILLVGPPGCGKTTRIGRAAADWGFYFRALMASLYEPQDFGGMAVPTDGELRLMAMPWLRDLSHKENGIVLFDELSSTAPATQKALLRGVFEGVFGETTLPKGIRFVAAM